MATVWLVEMDTGLRVRDWTATATTGVYTRVLSAEVDRVEGVKQDGTVLTEKTTTAEVDATTGTWYYDPATATIRIHTTDDAAPTAKVMVLTVLEPLCFGPTLRKLRGTATLLWLGRVLSLPAATQSVNVEQSGSVATFGGLSVANGDGRYDRLLGERIFSGYGVRVYRGDEDDTYASMTLWLKALMDQPVASRDSFDVPLVSLAKTLDKPALTAAYNTADFPSLPAANTGVLKPKIWGTVKAAVARRTSSGQWNVAGHAMTSIDAAYKADGTAVTITGTTLATGHFTANASYDTEDLLYADCRGYAYDNPGDLIEQIALDAGIAAADIDSNALDNVNTVRGVSVGVQITGGSYREALDKVAKSAFVVWYVDRTNTLTALAPDRFLNNRIQNGTGDVDASGWTTENNATLARVTDKKFRGAGALRVQKAAADQQARITAILTQSAANRRVVATMMAAAYAGTASATFKIGVADSLGTEMLSSDFALASTQWTRVTHRSRPITNYGIYCDQTDIGCDSTSINCDRGGVEVRIYPAYGVLTCADVALDDIDVADVLPVDDAVGEYVRSEIRGPALHQVRYGYAHVIRTNERRYVNACSTETERMFPTSESRTVDGSLVTSCDASITACAALAFYSAGRLVADVNVYEPLPISVGDVIDLNTTRRPTVPGASPLLRALSIDESQPTESEPPQLQVQAEGLYDPIWDLANLP